LAPTGRGRDMTMDLKCVRRPSCRAAGRGPVTG
jgi:hypothetical protein